MTRACQRVGASFASIAMVDAASPWPDYERSDVDPRLLLGLALGAATLLVAAPLVLSAIYPAARHEPLHQPNQLPPAPRLQINPGADLGAIRASETSRLSGYGWIDRTGNIVHIPIERAL